MPTWTASTFHVLVLLTDHNFPKHTRDTEDKIAIIRINYKTREQHHRFNEKTLEYKNMEKHTKVVTTE